MQYCKSTHSALFLMSLILVNLIPIKGLKGKNAVNLRCELAFLRLGGDFVEVIFLCMKRVKCELFLYNFVIDVATVPKMSRPHETLHPSHKCSS